MEVIKIRSISIDDATYRMLCEYKTRYSIKKNICLVVTKMLNEAMLLKKTSDSVELDKEYVLFTINSLQEQINNLNEQINNLNDKICALEKTK